MNQTVRGVLALGTILFASSFLTATAAEKDDMVANPMYKYWAQFKPGSTVTLLEKTVLSGPEKDTVPDGIDQKEVTYKLLSVTPEKVVVQTVVVEHDFLGTIEQPATKKTFPAKVSKTHLQGGFHGVDPKKGEEKITMLGKEMDCLTLAGLEKKEGSEVDHKLWVSEKVPGGVVKHTRVTKQDGKLVADTTITLKSFKAAD